MSALDFSTLMLADAEDFDYDLLLPYSTLKVCIWWCDWI